MNILYPAGVKREWFDRNPIVSVIAYENSPIAPHAATVRATYVCPINRRALIAITGLLIERVTVATAVGRTRVMARLSDGSTSVYVAQAIFYNIAVGSFAQLTVPQFGWLTYNQTLWLQSEDLATGGATNIQVGAQIVEFDA